MERKNCHTRPSLPQKTSERSELGLRAAPGLAENWLFTVAFMPRRERSLEAGVERLNEAKAASGAVRPVAK
jgi:hypothetical protein